MAATTYRVPRESTEGIGPFTVTEDGTGDSTFQVSIHAYGVRPTTWVDPETVDSITGCTVVGPASANWSGLTGPGKYRVSVRDKQTPSFERIGVAALLIT